MQKLLRFRMVMDKIIFLLTAHFIGDCALQPDRYAYGKSKDFRYMVNHCFIYAGIVSLMLYWLGIFSPFKYLALFISHLIIDFGLAEAGGSEKKGITGWVDLICHLTALGVICG